MTTQARRPWDPRSFEVLAYEAETSPAACPHCHAQPGTPCTNPRTGDVMPANHWQRKKAADQLEV